MIDISINMKPKRRVINEREREKIRKAHEMFDA
jgi:hypothetical protein